MQSTNYGMSKILIDLCVELIQNGMADRMRQRTIQFNTARVKHAVNRLGQWDLGWHPTTPFLWLKMPNGWRSSGFQSACERRGVLLRAADEFALIDGKAPNAVRVAIGATLSEQSFDDALTTIASVLQNPPMSAEI